MNRFDIPGYRIQFVFFVVSFVVSIVLLFFQQWLWAIFCNSVATNAAFICRFKRIEFALDGDSQKVSQ